MLTIRKQRPSTAAGMLFLLFLAFSLLIVSPLKVLSLDTQAPAIGSFGSITYQSDSVLLVTDSTLEGPVPYSIDGDSDYQTGSTYTLSPGTHTIELPSPYTSPISEVTYNFSHWQNDNSPDNPRTVTLAEGETRSLLAIYSTSSEPPPPRPPDGDELLAYTGFEYPTTVPTSGSASNMWEQNPGGIGLYFNNVNSYTTIDDSFSYSGSRSLRCTNYANYPNRVQPTIVIHRSEVYTSFMMYIPDFTMSWWAFSSIHEYDAPIGPEGGSLCLWLGDGAWFWRLSYQAISVGQLADSIRVVIYPTSYQIVESGTRDGDAAKMTINPMAVPRNRWFHFEQYIYRHRNNGIWKIWVDGQPLFSAENIWTSWHTDLNHKGHWMPFKVYGPSVTTWIDELALGTSYSLTSTPSNQSVYAQYELSMISSDAEMNVCGIRKKRELLQ